MTELTVSEEFEGERLDRYVTEALGQHSRSFIQRLIKDGHLRLNGTVPKPSAPVNSGDNIELEIPESVVPQIRPENIPLDIVFEDEDLLVVNKPKGMVVHPAPGHYEGTLVNALMYHCRDLSGINGILRPGIVHRIDRDTTGLLVVCKNDHTHNHLAQQFKDHTIERSYHAILTGHLKEPQGTINAPIGRDPGDRLKMAVHPGGKSAITHYEVISMPPEYTYVMCRLETGRTHQIRVHFSHIHHPLLGDEVYGKKSKFKTDGQTLHAKTLGFIHPGNGRFMQFDSELPEYFRNILNAIS